MTRDIAYGPATLTVREGPFAGEMVKAQHVLCDDGQRRNAFPSHDGIADSHNTIPAYVYAKGVRVYGIIVLQTYAGQLADITFRAHPYRRNARLVG